MTGPLGKVYRVNLEVCPIAIIIESLWISSSMGVRLMNTKYIVCIYVTENMNINILL